MRTITETYNVYSYAELSQKAKEAVAGWFLDDPYRAQEFKEIYTDDLGYLFPNSDLKLQFSLASCQGDGLNIYGRLDLTDVLNAIRDKVYCGDTFQEFWDFMTEKEQRTIEAYMDECGVCVELPQNRHYAYCVARNTDFANDWISELEYSRYRKINEEVIRKMEKLVVRMFTHLSRLYENYGYQYFYEPDECEIAEACEANGWEFLEDGTFYAV